MFLILQVLTFIFPSIFPFIDAKALHHAHLEAATVVPAVCPFEVALSMHFIFCPFSIVLGAV
jgi:hypothetical protein